MPKSSAPEDKAKAIKLGKRELPALEKAEFKVVAIGASAGGLEASRKLVDALPANSGMAFILVQHLDPTHPSMMVDLLSSHTKMKVEQAAQGMTLERDHIYVIPPGTYLSIKDQTLQLSRPLAPHGARLPFDFLLKSMADELGSNAICIILSGTGADGSIGLKSVHEKGGLVIAQDPAEAVYDGMPRSAMATGFVDHVLPVAKIPEVLTKVPAQKNSDSLQNIVELLRKTTNQDFTLYKLGTLQRRIERRMALAAISVGQMESYLKLLQTHPKEIELLAKNLLIHVTNFFRDPKVFDFLAEKIIPEIIGGQTDDKTIRVWIAGCSTGEEAYSLAILFREQIAAAKSNIKLQIFASDLDANAVAFAREGVYPETIKDDISPARLARFFSKDESGYRVSAEMRAAIIFTVQDVLSDPPFSRLDLISCRNLLIYLGPEAQAKVISMFHFALRQNGILLLGNAETISKPEGRFETISKAERVYRHIGRSRPGELNFLTNANDGARVVAKSGAVPAATRQTALAELCRRLVMESFAPAAVLINAKYECIYTLGPTDRYLSVAPGHSTHDVLAMARHSLRSKLKLAIVDSTKKNARVMSSGGRLKHNGEMVAFSIDARPIRSDGENLTLVCFVDEPSSNRKQDNASTPPNTSHMAELESELETTKIELKDAIRNLEVANEDQRAINEEASSVNEEYQSTNEELLTSKEELQSLNEELNALNAQLHETLDRQRSTSDDLQNILYSTNVATLFLDKDLKIRFFTPATKSLFNVIPTDVGRPLTDLNSLSADTALVTDAESVLKTSAAIDREIETQSGIWFIRRILPYKTSDERVEGVVITFTDVTERKAAKKLLQDATLKAELANIAKSRFLAAASHDLRQPLQTLALLQGLLAKNVESKKSKNLVGRLDQTLVAMTGMLNSLLDINQIEAGTVKVGKMDFQLAELLARLHDEFSYQAQSQKLKLHLASCHVMVHSDARLLEQMLRNLITNALKYTKTGKILLGCRRHKTSLTIEVWDTGIGIPEAEVQTIFEEFYQLDNAAHERSRGLGLGLSIVKRLGTLLDHKITVRSKPNKGSVFAIEVQLASGETKSSNKADQVIKISSDLETAKLKGTILVVEDDPEVRDLLELLLTSEGHTVVTAQDGATALDMADKKSIQPDIILSDYNLPNAMNGIEVTTKLRKKFKKRIPVIILTGDISTETLRKISAHDCVQLNKPVKVKEMTQVIQRLLSTPIALKVSVATTPIVFIVDDEAQIRDTMRALLEGEGHSVKDYASCEEFLKDYPANSKRCLLIDANLPGMKGIELLQRLGKSNEKLPAIMITGSGDVAMAVEAMKAGALDFVEKPISAAELIATVASAVEQSLDSSKRSAWQVEAALKISSLTKRQHQIMDMVVAGHPSKNIAADLGLSQRTVETHRAAIMHKTGSKSLPALARLALAASQ